MIPRRVLVTAMYLNLAGGCLAAAQTAPTTPAPAASSGSPAAKVGLFVYPKNEQNPQQQASDESACYGSAQQQTGIDPAAPPPAPQEADQKKGGAAQNSYFRPEVGMHRFSSNMGARNLLLIYTAPRYRRLSQASTAVEAYSGATMVEPGVWVYQITKKNLAR